MADEITMKRYFASQTNPAKAERLFEEWKKDQAKKVSKKVLKKDPPKSFKKG